MKKVIVFFAIVLVLVVVIGCKKDKIQLSWFQRLFVKEYYVMVDLNNTHKNTILPKIDEIRTTLREWVIWGEDTIQVHGPGGYTPTANKAWKVWLETYQRKFMPDTLVPPKIGELASIIKMYLDLRRKHDRDKSFTKMHLCIPKDLYEQDERFWEWWLTKIQTYLTVTLGGPDAWTDGTRQLWQEMEIYHLPTTSDPEDPWHNNCSAQIRITEWYKSYAEGPDKKMISISHMSLVRKNEGQVRHKNLLSCPEEGFPIGNPTDYETKFGAIGSVDVYYIEIPCVPTRWYYWGELCTRLFFLW